tara:strand:+ start:7746 stop:9389 length:1644 start_codon:yes stop_codon:yes gene_type:complete
MNDSKIIDTDINNFDYVRQNYLDLKTIYGLFNYNNIDPYDKLINKNDTVNNEYLEDFVHDFNKHDLQNCNFVETTVPKLYENKILTNSKNYSTRRLNAMSPNDDVPMYDNNDLLNDDYKEKDIKYDLDKMKYINMDYSFLQYMSNRGPDNSEGGFHDWALPPDFSEAKYKNSEKTRVSNNIEFRESDHLNNIDIKSKYKSQKPQKNNSKTMPLTDIQFQQPIESYVYTTSDKFNHYKGLSSLINNTMMNLPTERTIEYNSYLKKNNQPTNNKKIQGVSDVKLTNAKELMGNNNNSMIYNDAHLRNNIKHALFEILHNDLNDQYITSNRQSHKPQTMQTLNLNQSENFKFGLKDNKEHMFVKKNPIYQQIKDVVAQYLYYNSDKKNKNIDSIELFNNKYNTHIENKPFNIKDNNKIFNMIREEYDNLKDNKFYSMPNYFNKVNPHKSKLSISKLQSSENKNFNYIEYMNNNEFKSGGNNIIHLIDNNVNRNKAIDESLYDESLDTNDNVELFTNMGNHSLYNNTKNNNSYSRNYRHYTSNDLSFGSFS